MHTIESVYHNLEATLLREVALHEAIKELLSSQRSAILDRQPRHLMEVASLINARIAEAAILKTQREAAMHTLAELYVLPRPSRLSDFLELLDAKIAAPLKDLMHALNIHLSKSRRYVRLNQYLAARLLTVTRDIIQQMAPGKVVHTYNQKGSLRVASESPNAGLAFLA